MFFSIVFQGTESYKNALTILSFSPPVIFTPIAHIQQRFISEVFISQEVAAGYRREVPSSASFLDLLGAGTAPWGTRQHHRWDYPREARP